MTSANERLVHEWTERPYTGHRKRHIRVEFRLVASWHPGVGADIRKEARCPERGIEEWTTVEAWEFRDHGTEKVVTAEGAPLP